MSRPPSDAALDEAARGLGRALVRRGWQMAAAESCTGGLVGHVITQVPRSSDHFLGGIVSYSNAAKEELLGVPAGLLERTGAVSAEVAEAMARGAMERFGAGLGVGITGVAGPGGGTEEKPVGYVCICVADADGNVLARDPKLPGSRDDVRDRSASVAMHMIRRLLIGEDLPL